MHFVLKTVNLLFLCLEVQILMPVLGEYNVQVMVHRYQNPTHQFSTFINNVRYVSCCSVYNYADGRCYGDCSNTLDFCLRPAGTSRGSTKCHFGFEDTTSVIGDNILFGGTVGGLDNPLLFESVQQSWSGTFQLVVDIYSNRGVIDHIFIEPSPYRAGDTFTSPFRTTGEFSTASIVVSFKVDCSDNYYGDDCSTLCTQTERYTCNAIGERVCTENNYVLPDCVTECTPTDVHHCDSNGTRTCSREFYIPPACTEVCVDRDDLYGHYVCNLNGSKTCLDNYYGNNCTVYCEGRKGQSFCDKNGTLICEDGYYGDDCSEYCLERDDSTGHYKCDIDTGEKICLDGFMDPTNNCTEQVCNPPCNLAGGGCTSEGVTPRCECKDGWSSEQCLLCTSSTGKCSGVNLCSSINPCLNGGTCKSTPNTTYQANESVLSNYSITCECPEGYYGNLCENEEVTPDITTTVTPDITTTMDEVTLAEVKGTPGPANNVATVVPVVLVVLILVITAAVLTVVIVICVSWRRKHKLKPNNGDLTVRMLDVQQSFRDGIHNACYMPHAMGEYRGHSSTSDSETHDFDNPLYQSAEHREYSYPVFTRNTGTVTTTDNSADSGSNYSGSGVYSTIDNVPHARLFALRPSVARANYETVDIHFRSGVDLQNMRGSIITVDGFENSDTGDSQ